MYYHMTYLRNIGVVHILLLSFSFRYSTKQLKRFNQFKFICWSNIEMCDTSASYSNGICFLSNDDFDYMVTAKHAAEEAIGWKLLPENIVYRVEKMNPVQTKWGPRCIIQLRNVNGQDINVWAQSNVVRDLKSGFKLNGKDCLAFIKSLGEKETNVVGEPRKRVKG